MLKRVNPYLNIVKLRKSSRRTNSKNFTTGCNFETASRFSKNFFPSRSLSLESCASFEFEKIVLFFRVLCWGWPIVVKSSVSLSADESLEVSRPLLFSPSIIFCWIIFSSRTSSGMSSVSANDWNFFIFPFLYQDFQNNLRASVMRAVQGVPTLACRHTVHRLPPIMPSLPPFWELGKPAENLPTSGYMLGTGTISSIGKQTRRDDPSKPFLLLLRRLLCSCLTPTI